MTDEEQKELLKKVGEVRTFLMILVWQMWAVIIFVVLIYLFLRHQAGIQRYTR